MTALGIFATSSNDVQQFESWFGQDVDFVSANTGRASWSDWQGSIAWTASWTKPLDTPVHWTLPMFADGGTLAAAASGAYNAHYVQAAKDILNASNGQDQIVVRIGTEFNGSWFPWAAAGHEQDFVEAYHQFVDAFRSVSDKFALEWNVAVGAQGMDPSAAYPGDDYVDIVGGDFYYTKWLSPDPDQAWSQMLSQKYGLQWLSDFAAAHGKPMGFSEWGVQTDDAQKYIVNVGKWFASNNVAYQSYWNSNSGGFAGKLSTDQYPNTGDAFKSTFGSTIVTKTDAGGVLVSETTTYTSGADLSDTKDYTAGLLSRETVLHRDGSRDIFIFNIQSHTYSNEHDTYDAAGTLLNVVRTHTDNSLDFTYSVAPDHTKTTDQYDPSGSLRSHSVVYADGSSKTKAYAGSNLVTETAKFAAGSAELSDIKSFINGVLTRETVSHANGSKDVYIYGIQDQSYISEHDIYNASGAITKKLFTSNSGTTITTNYSGSTVISQITTYANGSDVSDTKLYTAGKVSTETVLHSDGTKDVYLSGLLNKTYIAERDTYNDAGKLSSVVRTHADDSLDYTYRVAPEGTRTTDQYDASGSMKSHSIVYADGSSNTKAYASGNLVFETVKFAAGSADLSDSKSFTNSVLTRETITHANGSKDVYMYGFQEQAYVSEHDIYNASGVITQKFMISNDGTTTTKNYSGNSLTSEIMTYADGPDISDTKLYTAGKISSETVLHSDGTKDVYLSGMLNKTFVAEHDTYNETGRLWNVARTHADDSLDYTYNVAHDGTKTTEQYDASGSLKSQSVVYADGSSDTRAYAGGNVATETVKFAAGSADLSDIKSFTDGALTRETVAHANGSKDVYDFNVAGKSYIADHFSYASGGSLSVADLTNNNGTHAVTAYASSATLTSNSGVADAFQSWSGGKDTFAFNQNFGHDTINGFHAGSGTSHDIISLDASMVPDYSHLQVQQIGHDTMVTVDTNDTILLTGVSASNLTTANFAFVHHDLL